MQTIAGGRSAAMLNEMFRRIDHAKGLGISDRWLDALVPDRSAAPLPAAKPMRVH